VSGFWTALLGSLIYSALMLVISMAMQSLLSR